jgi:hypothetical protein
MSERDLFTAPFALRMKKDCKDGYIVINEKKIGFSKIDGILLRLPRFWWPSQDFDLKDQIFIYHETIAAWYSLLWHLDCPIINKFDLGWWLNDVNYPILIKEKLARYLHINTVQSEFNSYVQSDRIYPSFPGNLPNVKSAYIVGKKIIHRTESGRLLLDSYLRENFDNLSSRLKENGIIFCRLDFECDENKEDGLKIRYVETFPLVNNEDRYILQKINNALGDLIL